MKRIVIVGNSSAGVGVADQIRQHDSQSQILIVTEELLGAYRRDRMLKYLAGELREKDLFFTDATFYRERKIEVLPDRCVVGIQTRKSRIEFKDKDPLEYDELILATGSKIRPGVLKGIRKEGVVLLSDLSCVKFIRHHLPLAHTVIVVGSDASAVALSRYVGSRSIDVKLIGAGIAPQEGVEVLPDVSVVEILGESDARAVRLSNQKVIGASLIVFTQPRLPNTEFLKGTDIMLEGTTVALPFGVERQGVVSETQPSGSVLSPENTDEPDDKDISAGAVLVDEEYRTNIDNIRAVGDVCVRAGQSKVLGWDAAANEGRALGRILCQVLI